MTQSEPNTTSQSSADHERRIEEAERRVIEEERPLKIYVASSWRNQHQPSVVQHLRGQGHEVYDFKNPRPGDRGFRWMEIDPEWQSWSPLEFRSALNDKIAEQGFTSDWEAMQWADVGVLVLPSGRSAHLEAGYFVGSKKPLIILVPESVEPELMYKMATCICVTLYEVIDALNALTTPVESIPEKVDEWEGFRLWECELGCCQIVNGHGHQWYRMRRRDGWEAWAPSPVAMQSCPPKWTHRNGPERLAILRTLPPDVRAAKGGGK